MPEAAPAGTPSDFHLVDAADPAQAVAKVLAVVRDRIPRAFGLDPVRDVQVLCPMNRGGVGARALNVALQQALNPPGESRVERFGSTYAPGDKVMQVENNYDREVTNGDLGLVSRIDNEAGELVATFDRREVIYPFGELDELVLAYATTIHKSQGSEYSASTIDSGTETYVFDDDRLPHCAGMAWAYCVSPRRRFRAEMLGQDGTRVRVGLAVGDAKARLDQHVGVVDDVAEAAPSRSASFTWGAPFFLDRRTFLVLDGRTVPGAPDAVGPFYAFH